MSELIAKAFEALGEGPTSRELDIVAAALEDEADAFWLARERPGQRSPRWRRSRSSAAPPGSWPWMDTVITTGESRLARDPFRAFFSAPPSSTATPSRGPYVSPVERAFEGRRPDEPADRQDGDDRRLHRRACPGGAPDHLIHARATRRRGWTASYRSGSVSFACFVRSRATCRSRSPVYRSS
jgi:hypothetical protein